MLSLDSTTISLCLTMFPWAKFRRAKGGVKAHLLLAHGDYLPAYVLLTEAKRRQRHFKQETSTPIACRSSSNTPVFTRPRYSSALSWTAVKWFSFHNFPLFNLK
jgi:hypothetical protein